MDKNKIKSHLQSFLAEADKQPVGKTETEKVQKQEKGVNNDYYKEVTKKMGDYDKASTGDADSIKSGDLEKTDSGEMDVNPNGMDQIQYDNDPSAKFKERAIEALEGSSKMGNKSYEGKWDPATGAGNGNTEEVWGASGGKHTGKEIVKSAKAVAKKDARPQEDVVGYVPQGKVKTKLATENNQSTNEIIKESSKMKKIKTAKQNGDKSYAVEYEDGTKKTIHVSHDDWDGINNKYGNLKEGMKRLKFKQPFNGIGKALTLIPEGYRVDNKVFEMTDGNENYTIRWEGTLTEGQAIVLKASDKQMMNEDIQHMKHLMGFKSESTLGTPTAKERVTENKTFRDIMNLTNKILEGKEEGDKKPIRESAFAGMGFTSEANIEKVAPAVSENEEEDIMDKEFQRRQKQKQDALNAASSSNTDTRDIYDLKQAAGTKDGNKGSHAVTESEDEYVDYTMGNKDDPNQLPNPPKTLNIESKCETPNNGGESSKIGASADGIVRGAGHDKHIMEEDDTLVGFDSPKVYSESEISAGTDLGTDIGKTAAGDPRGVGHDKHIMEEEEEEEETK